MPCDRRADGRLSVLWIDDQADSGTVHCLGLDGIAVDVAGTASEGLALARERAYDVVVLDLHLPDEHGLTVLERLRGYWKTLPILVLTGHYLDAEWKDYAERAGASAFRFKPLYADELAAVLREIVSGSDSAAVAVASGPNAELESAHISASRGLRHLLEGLERIAQCGAPNGAAPATPDDVLRLLLISFSGPEQPISEFLACTAALREFLTEPHPVRASDIAVRGRDTVAAVLNGFPRVHHPAVVETFRLLSTEPVRWAEEELARAVAVSRAHLGRLIKSETNLGFRELRRAFTTRAAIASVLTTREQFAQVAYRLGFADPTQFDHEFRATFGAAPGTLRKMWIELTYR